MEFRDWITAGATLFAIAGAYWKIIIKGNEQIAALDRQLRQHIEARLEEFMPRELIGKDLLSIQRQIEELKEAEADNRQIQDKMHTQNQGRQAEIKERQTELKQMIERGFRDLELKHTERTGHTGSGTKR